MAGARQVVDPPPFTPTPYGLLSVVDWIPTDDPHWQNGITYTAPCSTNLGGTTYDDCIAVTGAGGPPPHQAALSNTVSLLTRGATVFNAFAEFDCAPVGNAQAQQRAETAMVQAEAFQVERAFWTGVAGGQPVVFPHLAANAQVLDPNNSSIVLQTAAIDVSVTGVGSPAVNGDFLNPAAALGLLEQALAACYGGVGVIHVPALALPSLSPFVDTSGPIMRTKRGTKIAVGGGYPGTSPSGAGRPANSMWLYATGNVFGFRSPIHVRAPQGPQAFDRSNNTMKMIADRTFVIGWDCCHFAVPMALGVPKGT